MTIPPKKVLNSDPGTADIVGGNDWDDLADYMNNVDKTGPVIINTETKFRDGKFKLRNPANTFDTVLKSGAVGANRNVTAPVLTAYDDMVGRTTLQTLTGKTIDVKDNTIKLKENTYLVFREGSTYSAQKSDGTITSDSNFASLMNAIIATIPTQSLTTYTKIKIAPGDYIVTSTISCVDKYNVYIEGSGMDITNIRAGVGLADQTLIFDFHGSVSGTQKNLTANTVIKTATCTMASGDASTFAVNDRVLLRSTKKFGLGSSSNGYQGEIKIVSGIAGGVITFRDRLFDVYLTANTANVIKLKPAFNIAFSDFTIKPDSGYSSSDTVWWQMQFLENLSIRNVKVQDFPGQFGGYIDMFSCTEVRISDCNLKQTIAYNLQYGIVFESACNNCVVSNCTADGDMRHPFEAGTSPANRTDSQGAVRNVVFSGCTATGGGNVAFDTHPESEFITFDGCSVVGTNFAGGFKLRGPHSTLPNCMVRNAEGTGAGGNGEDAIRVADYGYGALITDCRIVDCNKMGIQIFDQLDNITIRNCFIENVTLDGIKFGAGTNNVTIMGCVIINCDQDGIDISDSDNLTISNNVIKNNAQWGIDFTAGDCTNNIIVGNRITG